MPWRDWQFYVVTLAALWAAWAVVRPFLPARDKPARKRTTLTVEGKKPGVRP